MGSILFLRANCINQDEKLIWLLSGKKKIKRDKTLPSSCNMMRQQAKYVICWKAHVRFFQTGWAYASDEYNLSKKGAIENKRQKCRGGKGSKLLKKGRWIRVKSKMIKSWRQFINNESWFSGFLKFFFSILLSVAQNQYLERK